MKRPRSDAAALLRPAAVVRYRRHVGYGIDADAQRGQRPHRRLAARTRALDADVERLDALVLRGAAGRLGCHLGRERRRLARALEALATARRPRERGALAIADRDDRVVERRVNVRDAVGDVFADLLAHALGGGTDGRFSHAADLWVSLSVRDRCGSLLDERASLALALAFA